MVWIYGRFVYDYDQDFCDEHDDVRGVVDWHWGCGALGSMWREWVDRADRVRERVYMHGDKCVVFPVFVVVYYISILISVSSFKPARGRIYSELMTLLHISSTLR